MVTLNRIAATRGLPATTNINNGGGFISKVMDRLVYKRSIELDFRLPGKPTDNAKIKSFNGHFRHKTSKIFVGFYRSTTLGSKSNSGSSTKIRRVPTLHYRREPCAHRALGHEKCRFGSKTLAGIFNLKPGLIRVQGAFNRPVF